MTIFDNLAADSSDLSFIVEDERKFSYNDLLNDAWLSYKDIQDRPALANEHQWYNEFKRYITNRTQDAKPEGITFAKEHTLLLDELHERKYSDYLHPKLSKYIDSIK